MKPHFYLLLLVLLPAHSVARADDVLKPVSFYRETTAKGVTTTLQLTLFRVEKIEGQQVGLLNAGKTTHHGRWPHYASGTSPSCTVRVVVVKVNGGRYRFTFVDPIGKMPAIQELLGIASPAFELTCETKKFGEHPEPEPVDSQQTSAQRIALRELAREVLGHKILRIKPIGQNNHADADSVSKPKSQGRPKMKEQPKVLSRCEYGTLVKRDDRFVFVLDKERNSDRWREQTAASFFFKQWRVLGNAKLEKAKPWREKEYAYIVSGGVGHYIDGMRHSFEGIRIFMARDSERPRLVGMTDAHGRYAIRLPQVDEGEQLYLFFSGGIDTAPDAEKSFPRRGIGANNDNLAVLKSDTITERYAVNVAAVEPVATSKP